MQEVQSLSPKGLARVTGWALLATIFVGIASSIFIAKGIDINMSADVAATAENMLEAELRLRAKAYIALLSVSLGAIVSVGLYLLLRKSGPLLAGWSLFVSLAASVTTLLGAVYAMNAAQIASNSAYADLQTQTQLMLTGLQATSDYTSFHLGLVLSSVSMAGFFYLFLRSGLIPKLLAGWGVFASIFVATIIVLRDFIPALGSDILTMAFMLSNLIAVIGLGLYLVIKGVRTEA